MAESVNTGADVAALNVGEGAAEGVAAAATTASAIDGAPSEEATATPEGDAFLETPPAATPPSIDWSRPVVTVPGISRRASFGESEERAYYDLQVNGIPFRSVNFNEFYLFKEALVKQFKAECKILPKFPGKTLGSPSEKTVNERRTLLGIWFAAVATNPTLSSSPAFREFIEMDVDLDAAQKELEMRCETIAAIPAGEWKQTASKKGVTIWTTKMQGSKFLLVKSLATFAAPMETVVWPLYIDKSKWVHWQADMKICKTIRVVGGALDSSNYKELLYTAIHIPVISDRDCHLYCHQYYGTPDDRREDSPSRMITTMSVRDNAVPKVKGFTRGNLEVSRTIFTSIDGGKATEIMTMMHMDPGGMLPAGLVNTIVASAVSSIVDMRTFMEAHHAQMP